MMFLLLCAALAADIWSYASQSDSGSADAAIVLGAAVFDDQPSPVFAARIDQGIALYREGRVRALVFTGGQGAGETEFESLAAAAYALQRGVPREAMFCETESHYTIENLLQARAIVRRHGFGRVLVVSDPLHMRRAMLIARDLGLDAHPSPTPITRYTGAGSQAQFLLSETLYYGQYLVQRALTPAQTIIATMPDTCWR